MMDFLKELFGNGGEDQELQVNCFPAANVETVPSSHIASEDNGKMVLNKAAKARQTCFESKL